MLDVAPVAVARAAALKGMLPPAHSVLIKATARNVKLCRGSIQEQVGRTIWSLKSGSVHASKLSVLPHVAHGGKKATEQSLTAALGIFLGETARLGEQGERAKV
jgi:hypothetical protein